VVRFVEKTSVPMAMFSMLQALPNTALWHRLEKEGRLIHEGGNGNQTTLMNFVPTRPIEEIAREYIDAFWTLYEPMAYLDRTFRHFMKIGIPRHSRSGSLEWKSIRALGILMWQQGLVRNTRVRFWINLFKIYQRSPKLIPHYLTVCAFFEHFNEYRQIVRDQITEQLEAYLAVKQEMPVEVDRVA
jgi:radical SAM superfamily enzyme YgiQ (UPF0313 family)